MIKGTYKRWGGACLLAVLLLLINVFPSLAYDRKIGSTKVSFSTGKRSQTENIEERDLSGNYNFYKYGIGVNSQPTKDYIFNAGVTHYIKDFETVNDNLDTVIDVYAAGLSFPPYKTSDTEYTLSLDYRLRTKRYRNSPSSEYDNNNFAVKIGTAFEKNYSVEFSGGLDNYEYINNHASDQLKTFLKIAPRFKSENGRVEVSSYYRRNWVENTVNTKNYSEDSFSIRPSFLLETPVFYKLAGYFGYGRSDTRDIDEDREDNLRFEYKVWDTTGYFKLRENVETDVTYGQTYRDYFTSVNGYNNWYVKDKTNITVYKKDDLSAGLTLNAEHKETDFYENDALSYKKNSLGSEFSVCKRSDYTISPFFAFIKYDYPPDSVKNEKQYKSGLKLKKYIKDTDNCFEGGYTYIWKDYRYINDIEQWVIRLSYLTKF